MNFTKEQIAKVFSEWAKRYAEEPESFAPVLDEGGEPVQDCGILSAEYFCQIAGELYPEQLFGQEQDTQL